MELELTSLFQFSLKRAQINTKSFIECAGKPPGVPVSQ